MNQSELLYQQAKKHIPAGVNSPVRAFGAVGGSPIFFDHGEGAYLYDVDGKRYIDYVASWGPLILGHAHPEIIAMVAQTAKKGLSFGASTELEVKLADKVCELMPNIEKIRMVNSGTEATMSAIRLARGFTGRNKIIKFEGCYHGHADCLLVKAGSGALTFGQPSSAGVTPGAANDTLIAQFNDSSSVAKLFKENTNEVAAVIVEPIPGNMNCISPQAGFLQSLRNLCDEHGALLIFDEVITGFRVGLGGAQERFGVKPDITTLGKILGGGMPVGAFGGRADIIDHISPTGPVYQAGTLSGNPVAMAAGLKTLELLQTLNPYKALEAMTAKLLEGMQNAARKHDIAFTTNQEGSMFGLFFANADTITSFAEVMRCDVTAFTQFYQSMLRTGIYFGPSAYETGFVSIAHTEADIKATLEAIDRAFAEMVTTTTSS